MAEAKGARVVKLSKPLADHGGQITELKLRPVTARVYIKNKTAPFDFQPLDEGRVKIVVTDYGLLVRWLADLSGVDESVLEDMSSDDLADATLALREMIVGAGN